MEEEQVLKLLFIFKAIHFPWNMTLVGLVQFYLDLLVAKSYDLKLLRSVIFFSPSKGQNMEEFM